MTFSLAAVIRVNAERRRVFDVVTSDAQTARQIATACGMPLRRTTRLLVELQSMHMVRHTKRGHPRGSGWIGVWWREER